MKARILFAILCVTLSCREIEDIFRVQSTGLPSPIDLSEFDDQGRLLEVRLTREFLKEGYVVSYQKKEVKDEGDSLLWTGLALGSLPCEKSIPIFETILASSEKNNGSFLRIDPLPDSYINDPTSRDMEVGALFGIILHLKNCDHIRPIKMLNNHFESIRRNDGRLFSQGDNSKININPSFRYFLNIISLKTLKTPRPPIVDASAFESGLLSNALFIKSAKKSCYPIHLSTLQLITLAYSGEPISTTTQKSFCEITDGLKLQLTDWYCGRLDVEEALTNYEVDKYSYQHQRCPAWENIETTYSNPALDWIVLKRLADGSIPVNP